MNYERRIPKHGSEKERDDEDSIFLYQIQPSTSNTKHTVKPRALKMTRSNAQRVIDMKSRIWINRHGRMNVVNIQLY